MIKFVSFALYPNRDYLEGPEATDPEVRRALMNTWVEEDMTDVSCRQREPDEEFFKVSASAFCYNVTTHQEGIRINIFYVMKYPTYTSFGPETPKV